MTTHCPDQAADTESTDQFHNQAVSLTTHAAKVSNVSQCPGKVADTESTDQCPKQAVPQTGSADGASDATQCPNQAAGCGTGTPEPCSSSHCGTCRSVS